jgi:hypothetical protein
MIHGSHFSLSSRSTTATQKTPKSGHASSHEHDEHEMRDPWQDPASISRPQPIAKRATPPDLLEKASDDSGWRMKSEDDELPLQGIQVKKDVAWTRSEGPGV